MHHMRFQIEKCMGLVATCLPGTSVTKGACVRNTI